MHQPQTPLPIQNYVDGRLQSAPEQFRVPAGQHFAGWVAARGRKFWQALGRLESLALEDELAAQTIEKPVYVCGLARSGTTILLEMLYATGAFAAHQYRDYPFIDIPVLWNGWLSVLPAGRETLQERAHLDGLMISSQSPEALEEMIWMHFFPGAHDPAQVNVLDVDTANRPFTAFYHDHIRKILTLRKRGRYLAKGNYNIVRLGYLQKIFPDARFIVPVRDPVDHIASLMKQHALFCRVEQQNPRALRYMQWVGHYEFGLDRRPLNIGDAAGLAKIQSFWAAGDEVGGWAHYWASLHGWLADRLQHSPSLAAAVKVVDYSGLCRAPQDNLSAIFGFCELDDSAAMAQSLAGSVKPQAYYQHGFEEEIIQRIRKVTDEPYRRLSSFF